MLEKTHNLKDSISVDNYNYKYVLKELSQKRYALEGAEYLLFTLQQVQIQLLKLVGFLLNLSQEHHNQKFYQHPNNAMYSIIEDMFYSQLYLLTTLL